MKQLLLILLLPSFVYAITCDDLGLYAFQLEGCPHSKLGVDTKIPLCDQPQWKYLAWMDERCYYEVPIDANCQGWTCAAPYDKVLIEPITGSYKLFRGPRELVDWNYRACREGYRAAAEELKNKRRKK